jgi:hypothetical protein
MMHPYCSSENGQNYIYNQIRLNVEITFLSDGSSRLNLSFIFLRACYRGIRHKSTTLTLAFRNGHINNQFTAHR